MTSCRKVAGVVLSEADCDWTKARSHTDTVTQQSYHSPHLNVSMKKPGLALEDLLALIEAQRDQIERLERQVNSLSSARADQVNQNDNQTETVSQTNTTTSTSEKRLQDLEDVVIDIKGEMMELMFVYQDVQDKLFDIDRYVLIILMALQEPPSSCFRSWQNSLVFLGVKHDTSCVYESSDCTENRVRELLRTVLNIRRDIQFLRVLRVYNGPEVRSGYRPIIACFSVSRVSQSRNHRVT